IRFTTPMLYALAFIPIFTIGGVTGVMLAMASADYQYHNTMFLVAHFHYVLIPGTVFAVLAGFTYWWPKIFGFSLSEKIGKWSFWFIAIGFNVAFFPMFITGLNGQARRMYTYSESTGFGPLNLLSFVGALGLAVGFALIVYNIYWSTRYAKRHVTEDPWNARSLEWATHSPIPEYNFAITPQANSIQAFWDYKETKKPLFVGHYEPIHMPNNSGWPIIMSAIFCILGFSFVFSMWIPAIISAIGIFVCLLVRYFDP